MSEEDWYRRGAATAFAVPFEDVTKGQRQNFKEAFFNCMWMYIYKLAPVDREQFMAHIDAFAKAMSAGKSFEEAKQVVTDSLPTEKK